MMMSKENSRVHPSASSHSHDFSPARYEVTSAHSQELANVKVQSSSISSSHAIQKKNNTKTKNYNA